MPTTKEKELEELRESNHRLKLTLDSTKQLHKNELEYLKEEIQIKEKEFKVLEDKLRAQLKKKVTDGQINSVNDDTYETAIQENNDLKAQVQHLQRNIEQLKSVQVDRISFYEENESLKIQNDRLNIELANTRELLEHQQSKLHGVSQQAIQDMSTIEDLRQQIESRDSYIAELQSRMKELENDKQEAIMEMQQSQMLLQQNVRQDAEDPTRRGNSLFSEVDERRVRVEAELVRLRERIARLTAENHEHKSKAERAQSRNGMILKQLQLMQQNEIDVVKEFKKLQSETIPTFTYYRDKVEALKNEYKRKLLQYRDGVLPPVMGEVESLRNERDLLLSQKVGIEQEIWELRKELKFANSRLVDMDARCMIFRTKLQAFQEGVISGGDKPQVWYEGGNGSDTTINGTFVQNVDGDDSNGNRKWFHETILNCSSVPQAHNPSTQQELEIPVRNPKESSSRGTKSSAEPEEITECNQQ